MGTTRLCHDPSTSYDAEGERSTNAEHIPSEKTPGTGTALLILVVMKWRTLFGAAL